MTMSNRLRLAILAMAEAVSHHPVRPNARSCLSGIAVKKRAFGARTISPGSQPFRLERIVTQLNIDMIGRSRPAGDTNPLNAELSGANEIFVIGSKMMSTELGNP